MKLVLISDTHTFHKQVQVPDGDVLIHAGDMGASGRFEEIQECLTWLNGQPHEHVVAIAGNHDWAFAREHQKGYLDLGRIVYLEDSGATIDGVSFYGSPWQPWFCNWAFNVDRGPAIKAYWDKIPAGTDVLITHGPPRGILDQCAPHFQSDHLGCDDLREAVERVSPKVHVFGHIHGGYGCTVRKQTRFYNASQVNEAYKIANKPWVVEI